MQTAQFYPARPTLAEVIAALVAGALAVGAALTLPGMPLDDTGELAITISPDDGAWWVLIALLAVQVVLLMWAGHFPQAVLMGIAVMPALHAALIPGTTFSLVTVAVSFAVFWAAIRRPLGELRVALSVVVVLVAGAQTLNDIRVASSFDLGTVLAAVLQAVTVVAVPLIIGLFLAARTEARECRTNEIAALKSERDALIQAAVARERMSMSRELHDIAAHHMSGIALLASAIYKQVDLDPDAAKLSAEQVRTQTKTVLDDLRRVIGLLRDEADGTRSVETLQSIHGLVQTRIGTRLEVRTGDHELGTGIGPLAQLVAYRMVQESLANVATHAPGANCVVEIDDRHADHLIVAVTNDGQHAPDPGPGSGFGLVGMRERADLVGAELSYGATEDGGWHVELTMRRELP